MLELLEYWQQEPPAHVLLALRYLGGAKRNSGPTEEQAKQDMGQMTALLGKSPQKLPDHLRRMVEEAEQLKQQHKGMS